MKKLILFFVAVILLGSCNDDIIVGIEYQLDIKVNNMDVVNDINVEGSEFFEDGEIGYSDYKVRVTSLIYSDDKLVAEDSKLVDNFSSEVNFTTPIGKGKYTIVVCTDLVEVKNGDISFEFWQCTEKGSLSGFKIKDLGSWGLDAKVLGVKKEEVLINDFKAVTIKPEPVGSLVVFEFKNLDKTKISVVEYTVVDWNNYYSVNSGLSVAIENFNFLQSYEVGTQSNTYDWIYLLPMENQSLWIDVYSLTGESILSGAIEFDVEVGKNLMIELDVQSGNYNIDEASSSKSALIQSKFQIDKMCSDIKQQQ